MEELNKKLALWAGWKVGSPTLKHKDHTHDELQEKKVTMWLCPDDLLHHTPPALTEFLDACFEWLVPKMPSVIVFLAPEEQKATIYCVHNGYTEDYDGYGKPLALALCLAIEKLMDNGA